MPACPMPITGHYICQACSPVVLVGWGALVSCPYLPGLQQVTNSLHKVSGGTGEGEEGSNSHVHVSLICMHTAVKRGLKSTVGSTSIWDRSDCMSDHRALGDGSLHGTAPQLLVEKGDQ